MHDIFLNQSGAVCFEYYDYFEHHMFTHFNCTMLYFDGFNRRVAAFVNVQFNMKLRTQIGKGVENIFPGSFIQCNLKIEFPDDVDLFL